MDPTHQSIRFGNRLRALRGDAGLSQERLAKLARIAQNHISKMERGERLPSWRTLRRLARILPGEAPRELLLL